MIILHLEAGICGRSDSLLQQYEEYSDPIVYLNKTSSKSTEDLKPYMKTQAITKLQTDYYKNGNKKYEVYMIDGKLEGVYTIWYETGELQSEIEYENGRRHGKLVEYYKNGQVSAIMYYNNGSIIDERKTTYFENGQIRTQFVDGQEIYYILENN